jgi:pyruvate/2-oxoacid:ferredoxin oxidoreductase alpha subunit
MNGEKMLLSGNHAVAWGVRRVRPDVIPVYPITPQTPILEKVMEFARNGDMQAEMLTPESEHSAISACVAASLTGARVFTATSSQGLLLMHEILHYAAGARAPIVVFNVNRTVASPWGFWPDQTDSLSQRDTGWIQFYSESPQESIDTCILSYRIAEEVSLPVMISHEAFYVSHAMEEVDVPTQEIVDEFLPAFNPEFTLDPDKGQSFGAPIDQPTYNLLRRKMSQAMDEVIPACESAREAWQEASGRDYGIYEEYRADDADVLLVTMGSLAGTAREVVDDMREAGHKVGLFKIRLLRTSPSEQIREALSGDRPLIVMDRNLSPGMGGVLHQELKAALYGLDNPPPVHGVLVGVGGTNVTPGSMREIVLTYKDAEPSVHSLWTEQ